MAAQPDEHELRGNADNFGGTKVMNEQLEKLIQLHGDKYTIETLEGEVSLHPAISGFESWYISIDGENEFGLFETNELSLEPYLIDTFDNIFDALDCAEELK